MIHALFLSTALVGQADPSALTRMREDVAYLAGPELKGRGHGSPGLELAMNHLQRAYRALGLRSEISRFTTPGPVSRVWAQARLDGRPMVFGQDLTPLGEVEGTFDGLPVHFAGCGLRGERRDDLKGVPLAGAVALILRETSGPGAADLPVGDRRLSVRIQALARAGARAVLVADPGRHTLPMALQEGHGPFPIPVLGIPMARVEQLLHGFEARASEFRRSGETGAVTPMGRLDLRLAYARPTLQSPNLTVWIPGRHPERSREFLVLGAHADHLGETGGTLSFAEEAHRHAPHPGADDNASGTALVLELARQLVQTPPDRSILLVHFSSEEQGLLGSKAWIEAPPVPRAQLRAMLNFDMVGRLPERKGTLWMGSLNVDPTQLKPLATHVPSDINLSHDLGPLTWASDHASFAAVGIPVLFWFSGLHEDYHRPSDTSDKIRVGGMLRIRDAALSVIRDLGNRPELNLGAPVRPVVPGAGSGQTANSHPPEGSR